MLLSRKSSEISTVYLASFGDARIYYDYSAFLGGWFILDVPPLHGTTKFEYRRVRQFFKELQHEYPIYCTLDTPDTAWFKNHVEHDSIHDGVTVYRWKDIK